VEEALLHHDWIYRWSEMFRVARIKPSPRMAAREQRLKDMASGANENDAMTRRLNWPHSICKL
jgi:hypothetical protein